MINHFVGTKPAQVKAWWRRCSYCPRICMLLTCALCVLRIAVPVDPAIVIGGSMDPTLHSGQLVWIDRSFYRSDTPSVGDVVCAMIDGERHIKRVVALGGQTVWLWLDHPDKTADSTCPVVSSDLLPRMRRTMQYTLSSGRAFPIHVAHNCVFLLGDNIERSFDSRDYGPVPLRSIIGRVLPAGNQTLAPSNYAKLVLGSTFDPETPILISHRATTTDRSSYVSVE